jgi:hypothetical protein
VKVWLWNVPNPQPSFIMLLVEDADGKAVGITFDGSPASRKCVAIEQAEVHKSWPHGWTRIA